jgi:hypothetical protein
MTASGPEPTNYDVRVLRLLYLSLISSPGCHSVPPRGQNVVIVFRAYWRMRPVADLLMQLAAAHQAAGDVGRLECRAFRR